MSQAESSAILAKIQEQTLYQKKIYIIDEEIEYSIKHFKP